MKKTTIDELKVIWDKLLGALFFTAGAYILILWLDYLVKTEYGEFVLLTLATFLFTIVSGVVMCLSWEFKVRKIGTDMGELFEIRVLKVPNPYRKRK